MKFLFRVLQQLVTPIVPIADPDQYQQARILASVSLAVLLAALIGIFLTSPSYSPTQVINVAPVVGGFLFFLVPYYQSRRGQLRSASIVIALTALLLLFITALRIGDDIGRDTLYYNVLVILFSLVFLSNEYTMIFVLLSFAFILLFGALNPGLPLIAVIRGPLVFNMIATFFIIILTFIWRQREIEKQQYIQASERQKAQLMLRREQYSILAQFVNAVSHDLRTRLSLIETNRFFVKRLLEDNEIGEQADKRLENIHGIVDDIDQQISNLNVIVNLGNPLMEAVNLNDVVNKVYDELLATSQEMDIQLVKQTMDTSITVISNFDHLVIAVLHLTQNALTYSNSGGVVTLSVNDTEVYGCIAVDDTGIGISPKHRDHIFEIFYKTNTARTTTHSGLGLGLTIVKLIAEAYSGKVNVESVEDKGSTFTLCLPLKTFQTHTSRHIINTPATALLVD